MDLVNSLVNDVLMPGIGLLVGGVDFSNLAIQLSPATASRAAVELRYGTFINAVIDFAIVAFVIFLVVKVMNTLMSRAQEATTQDCPVCLMQIPVKAKKCGHCLSPLGTTSVIVQ